ncbi:phosphodiester glycosidase family protein [Hymenobacter negativus]|uniref:Phosphodiester glycosidase family protein n=1 Tax=Hymenobacter negativus TaxID=2795026 RepID=A0ABS3QEL0_9BACT|nr:phosphodiester glycosidase family protein [Hymenobacter negativus]MBO2009686.1 phosphodiester glycosidase family protein [Hymenobacter negativus]
MRRLLLVLLESLAAFEAGSSALLPQAKADALVWQQLDQGLALGEYTPVSKSELGDSKITILRINPNFYAFRLLESVRFKDQRKTAAQWCQQEKLVACINAGMYQPDGQNTGYMRNYKSINNTAFNADNCLLAFNPTDSSQAEIKLIDRGCEADWEQQAQRYQSVSQSVRMIDCHQNNTWAQQPKKWSSAVWGMDKEGQALMIFCRSPYTMHDYVDILLQAPLNIQQAMYLEGGPEASLYLKSGATERNLFGSYETGFTENDNSQEAFALPNVIGIVRKGASSAASGR